jgi:imidazolonepropionase
MQHSGAPGTAVWDTLWRNVHLAPMTGGAAGVDAGSGASADADADAGGGATAVIRNAALATRDGRIAWLGRESDLPAGAAARTEIAGDGAWLLPGVIDCHTHLVHAGDRAAEFEQRLAGASYTDIARAGGGIQGTVRSTRAASEAQLYAASAARLREMRAAGVTTVEIKSGYGLELASEARMLRVARQLAQRENVRVVTTFLGAHALPPEYAGRADDYIDTLCSEMLPALIRDGLVDSVDAFCDEIGFTPAQTERVFIAARGAGLPVRLHAEQLSNQGGAALAARYAALSCDHLEYLDEAGATAMAAAGTVAVLLPAAFYFLRETRLPPIELLRRLRIPIAIATDCNPGSAPLTSPLLALNMACTLFRLTCDEALAGMTTHAARALGLQHEIGSLAPGKRADFALWNIERPAELCYRIGGNPLRARVRAGVSDTRGD